MTPADIRAVIDNGGPDIVYQPIVKLVGRAVVEGYEALSRFPGDLPPDVWFKTAHAEGLGFELELAALTKATSIFRKYLGGFRSELGYLALNVTPRALLHPPIRQFFGIVDTHVPIHLVLELSESQIISDTEYDKVLDAINELRAIGVALAIDDLGAGFSSLKHVLRLHPEQIKIDRSLCATVPDDREELAIVSAIVVMSRGMGAQSIAEGVERQEQADALTLLGVQSGQGFLFGRPGPLPKDLA